MTRDSHTTGAGPVHNATRLISQPGALSARDHRVFHPRNRAFCQRLVRAALDQPEVRSATVLLDEHMFRLEFAREAISQPEMAERLAAAVTAALAPGAPDDAGREWDTLSGYQGDEGRAVWATARDGRRALRVWRVPLCDDRAQTQRLTDRLEALRGVRSCRPARRGALRVRYDPARTDPPAIVAALATCRAGAEPALVATGVRRLAYLALAGGSFALTVVGFAVPGVPTVPFLLLTSYYLVRSSPALNRRLLRSRVFGPILRDWEERGGMRWSSKRKLIVLSLTIFGITLLAFTPPLEVVVVVVIVGAASMLSIVKLPGLPEQPPSSPSFVPA